MLHLREMGLLKLDAMTVTGEPLGRLLDWWQSSPRRQRLRQTLIERDGVDPDEVIFSPEVARGRGVTSTVCFPRGNLAPEGSVIKSTAIDPSLIDPDGVYRKTGPARVFTSEREAIAAIKGNGPRRVRPGDVLVLAGRGPLGSGMEETYQITSALRYLSWGKQVAVLTDARFSGVSTGACIGHISPEALAGGPVGKLRDGDQIQITVDCRRLEGSVDLVGDAQRDFNPAEAQRVLDERDLHKGIRPDERLPDDTRLWAALQQASGGTWQGCVFDTERIIAALEAGRRALGNESTGKNGVR